ncbi:MAG: hypothetical protein ACE5HT_00995 [Gemmatimonadales bacterium]
MFERLRAAINAALDAATVSHDPREAASKMREAVIEARAGIELMRRGVLEVETELSSQRSQLADAERRGRLADGIDDVETVAVANRFVEKHRARIGVLEQKLEAQRAELALAERELEEMKSDLKRVGSSQAEAAWREIENAGGTRPATDVDGDLLRSRLDRAAREAHAEAQLEALKKKMGK